MSNAGYPRKLIETCGTARGVRMSAVRGSITTAGEENTIISDLERTSAAAAAAAAAAEELDL